MAKKKESQYQNWQEVDAAMRELGELNIEKENIEGKIQLRLNELKAFGQEKLAPIVTRIKNIEKEIERFAAQNKDEFLLTRNKRLSYGTISYRLTKRVVCKCVDAAINTLKVLNLDFLLRTKTELNKDEILNYTCNDKSFSQTLAKANISIVTEDKIRIEPDYIKLAAKINNGEKDD